MKNVLSLILFLIFSINTFALSKSIEKTYTKATLSFDQSSIVFDDVDKVIKEQVIWAKLTLKHKPGWHSYWENPADSGQPTTISWTFPENISAREIVWDYPTIFYLGPIVNYGYDQIANLIIPIKINQAPVTKNILFTADVNWLVCEEECIPENAFFEFNFPSSVTSYKSNDASTIYSKRDKLLSTQHIKTSFNILNDQFNLKIPNSISENNIKSLYFFPKEHPVIKYKKSQEIEQKDGFMILSTEGISTGLTEISGFLQVNTINDQFYIRVSASNEIKIASSSLSFLTFMAFAFLGGLILNIMPCVFPVLSLKVLAMVQKAKQEPLKIKQESLAYTFGVLISFYLLVSILVLLKALGQQIGWGFQLQSPIFIYFMMALMMLVGLNLNGFFELPNWLISVPGKLSSVHTKTTTQNNNWGSFFTGVLAVIIATPCTAPFMAPAIGFAFTQPLLINLLIFTALGIGFSSPYVLVSFFPDLISFIPKPGKWMIRAKHILAIPMYLTVLWLISVFYFQLNIIGLVIALCLVLALVIYCLTGVFESKTIQTLYKILTILLIMGLSFLVYNLELKSKPLSTEATFEKLDTILANNQSAFVDVTAAWCLSCKVNEELVLNTNEIQTFFSKNKIEYIVLDWTNEDPLISNYLSSFKREGVPLYVYYNNGKKKILPQVLTKKMIKNLVQEN